MTIIRYVCIGLFCLACFAAVDAAQAAGSRQKITIVYTGQTHAALYPCHCPVEPDGGLARRASFLKELRKKDPYAIVLDAGNAFAGGIFDESSRSPEMDMRRTVVNLKAMEAMGYNALAIGADELNFGVDFLRKSFTNSRLDFLSANVRINGAKEFIVLEVEGVRIGVIGVTDPSITPKLGASDEVTEASAAVSEAIGKVRKLGAELVVVLSTLDKEGLKALVNTVSGIDVLINSNSMNKDMPVSSAFGSMIMLNSSWQGRGVGVLDLEMDAGKIRSSSSRTVMLSADFSDDKEMAALVPACFADTDCTKKGMVARCQNPGTVRAACSFSAAHPVGLTIIAPKEEFAPDNKRIIEYLKRLFPGLKVSYLYYPQKPAAKLVKELGLKTLPAFLFGKEAETENGFTALGNSLEQKGGYFLLNSRLAGISLFLDRKKESGRIDFFFSLFYPHAAALIGSIREFDPTPHFLSVSRAAHFDVSRGDPEKEELLRSVCVQKHAPARLWDYLGCRAQHINSTWWQECLPQEDAAAVSSCARSKEGERLLNENTALARELPVSTGPAYLIDNQQIYGSGREVPKKEEFKRLFRKK